MKELTLQELKEIELETLKMFDAFCKENNIRYFLAFGTLLGAVRYKKFIPWDDDVDLLVPREDYDRLLKLFKDTDKYHLFAFEKDDRFRFPFAKLCDMTTRKVEDYSPENALDLGVELDIFPLDHFDDDYDRAKDEAHRIWKYMARLGYTKVKKPLTNNPLKYAFWSVKIAYYKMLGGKHFIKKIIKECNKSSQSDSRYVGAKAWCIYDARGIVPAKAFEESVEIEFEGLMFPAPKGWDEYLTCLYGDYLPEPPKEKQKSHHTFTAYRV